MKPGALTKTFGERSGPKGDLCWIVPRDIDPCVPAGFGFAGRALRFPLQVYGPEVSIRLGLWKPEVVAVTFGILLVSSVSTRLTSTGGPSMPDITHLSSRCPSAMQVNQRTRLGVQAAQRWAGEVIAVPLKVTDEIAASRTYLGATLRRFNLDGVGTPARAIAEVCR